MERAGSVMWRRKWFRTMALKALSSISEIRLYEGVSGTAAFLPCCDDRA